VEILSWLQNLGADANAVAPGFQAKPMYVFMCIALPVAMGLVVGMGLRLIERMFGIELGRGGGH